MGWPVAPKGGSPSSQPGWRSALGGSCGHSPVQVMTPEAEEKTPPRSWPPSMGSRLEAVITPPRPLGRRRGVESAVRLTTVVVEQTGQGWQRNGGAAESLHRPAPASVLAIEWDVPAGTFVCAVTDEADDPLLRVKASCGRRERPWGGPPSRGRSPFGGHLGGHRPTPSPGAAGHGRSSAGWTGALVS